MADGHKDLRLSPPPLAPLQYLQNQRRGSITDPSLHAASNPSKLSQSSPPSKHTLTDPRPASPYVFGDATPHPPDNTPQIRNLLRSPSIEHSTGRSSSVDSKHSPTAHSKTSDAFKSNDASMQMNVDSDKLPQNRRILRDQPHFDYNMRRHSIAVGQEAHIPHGTKRKMSMDRSIFPPVGEEIDPQLVGPGVPSSMDIDGDVPAPKRRGSAIDTQKIAQLTLNDRRNSVDSRASQWWLNDRRGSTSSIYSSTSTMGGYSPGFSGSESPHARAPPGIATFAWPANPHAGETIASGVQPNGEQGLPPLPHPFDSSSPMAIISPMSFPSDRRMSVPDNSAPPAPTRTLRSRSRPPSRQTANTDSQSGSKSSNSEESAPVTALSKEKPAKEPNSTPYSRSPELRVSHKLAERKRRKEMKDLFDELRDQLPADRGMKASKWEILSKAIDFVAHLKHAHQEMAREIEMLRHELDAARQGGIASFPAGPPPPHAIVYGQGPPVSVSGTYPLPGPIPHSMPSHQPLSRPTSSPSLLSSNTAPSEESSKTERTEAPA